MRSVALDVGTKKIGVAITDIDKKFITILSNIKIQQISSTKFNFDAKAVLDLLQAKLSSYLHEIDQVIIGNSEDSEYLNNYRISDCQKQLYRVLKSNTSWEVFEEFEIYSSVESFKILKSLNFSPKQIKKKIDSCAAAVILSNFFLNKGKEMIIGF